MIYLDHNATTPVVPEARAAMMDALERAWGNPSSGHAAGRAARELLDGARETVARLAGAAPEHVVFTSGATEAIHQVIASLHGGRLLASAVEHPAVFGAADRCHDIETVRVPVGRDGRVQAADVLDALEGPPRACGVAVMGANNETGIVQPVGDLAPALRERGVPLLVDAVQLAGRLPLGFTPDYLVVTAHKLGGPKGAGAIVCAPWAFERLAPLFVGGGQEQRKRGGTEPLPAIAGFAAAVQRVLDTRDAESARVAALRDQLQAGLLDALPGSAAVGATSPRLPNTLSFLLPEGVEAEAVVARLSRAGVMASTGSACTSGSPKPSRVLLEMGLSPDQCFRVLRLSLGWTTTAAEIERVLDILPRTAREAAAR